MFAATARYANFSGLVAKKKRNYVRGNERNLTEFVAAQKYKTEKSRGQAKRMPLVPVQLSFELPQAESLKESNSEYLFNFSSNI